jgi:hypothetical protein
MASFLLEKNINVYKCCFYWFVMVFKGLKEGKRLFFIFVVGFLFLGSVSAFDSISDYKRGMSRGVL